MPVLFIICIGVILYVVLMPILSNKSQPLEETDGFFKAMQADYDELKIS